MPQSAQHPLLFNRSENIAITSKDFLLFSELLRRQEADDILMDLTEVHEAAAGLQPPNGSGLLELEAEEALTTTMVVIVALSASLLVASLLSAALLVIYCRRVKVRGRINFQPPFFLKYPFGATSILRPFCQDFFLIYMIYTYFYIGAEAPLCRLSDLFSCLFLPDLLWILQL